MNTYKLKLKDIVSEEHYKQLTQLGIIEIIVTPYDPPILVRYDGKKFVVTDNDYIKPLEQ
tara:strand:+ start:290 stop:469 length:180 start_codon:yes stop_codon:yes gene_type:complete